MCVCSAALRAQLATQGEQIDALTKKVGKLNVKVDSKHECVGLWTSKDKQTVRKVLRGPKKGIYTQTEAGTKMFNPEDWVEMPEAEADIRIAAHENWKASSPTK